jgi:hypothetical protein
VREGQPQLQALSEGPITQWSRPRPLNLIVLRALGSLKADRLSAFIAAGYDAGVVEEGPAAVDEDGHDRELG